MNALTDWFRLLGSAKSAPALSPPPAASPQNAGAVPSVAITRGSAMYDVFSGSAAGELPALNERTAASVSAVYGCVNLIAGAISALPMHIYNVLPDNQRERRMDDPLWWVLNEEFCPRWVASAGWEYLVCSRLFHGDSFAKIERSGSRITGLLPRHPLLTEVVPSADQKRLIYVFYPDVYDAGGQIEVLDQDDVLHVPGFGFDGCRSMSPLRYALRNAGGLAKVAQDYSGQYFTNGAEPGLIIKHEKSLTDQQKVNLKSEIDQRYSRSNGGAHRPMLLEGGLDIKTLALTNEDSQLIETRRFQVEEIARVYGVPPFMIGSNEKTTSFGTGVSEMGTAFVRYTLRSHLNAFQNEINRKFFRTPRIVSDFDTFELERGDMRGMFEAFRIALGNGQGPGFLSVDEVRAYINRNRVPGGETINLGMGTGNVQTQ